MTSAHDVLSTSGLNNTCILITSHPIRTGKYYSPKIPFFTGTKSKSTHERQTAAATTCSETVERAPQTIQHGEDDDMERKVRASERVCNCCMGMVV